MAMEVQDDLHANDSMISNNSPYQPTTDPVPHRRTVCAGLILDLMYIKSHRGILKIAEIVACIIVLICTGAVSFCSPCSGLSFINTVSITALIVNLILFVVFGLTLTTKIPFIHWIFTDLLNSGIATILFIISSIVLATQCSQAADTAAAVFGFITAALFGVGTWMGYRAFIVDRHRHNSNVSHVQGVPDNV